LAADGAPPPPLNAALVARYLPKPELLPTYRYPRLHCREPQTADGGDENGNFNRHDGGRGGDAWAAPGMTGRTGFLGGGGMPRVLGSTAASAEGARAAVRQQARASAPFPHLLFRWHPPTHPKE
jgi:hypothetical protein